MGLDIFMLKLLPVYSFEPQYLQWTASAACPSREHSMHAWVVISSFLACANSTDTMPVGTAITAYPIIISTDEISWPNADVGVISP